MSNIHAPQTLRCGDDWVFSGPLQDDSGAPLPLSGATFSWRLDSLDGKTNYLSLTLNNGVTVIDIPTATVSYGPTAAQTTPLTPGTYYDYLLVTLANSGGTFTVVEGIINAAPSST